MKTFFTRDEPIVPGHHPRVLVDTAVAQGAVRSEVLEGSGIVYEKLLEPETRVSYGQYERLAQNAIRLTDNPAIGLDFGKNALLTHWGVLGLAAANSKTAGAAMELGLKYYRNFAPGWDLTMRVEAGQGYFIARETIARGGFSVFATEAMLTTMKQLCEQVLRKPLPVRELRLSYPKPAHAARYEGLLDGVIVYDHPVTEVLFDPAILDEPIVGADPAMAVVAERYCAAEAAQTPQTDGLLAQVQRVLVDRVQSRPRLDEVARELRTSARSLRRGLQQMGTSYQKLLDEALRAHAERRLRMGGPKLEQVAQELGFADVRSFRRAFKRWTGATPKSFRNGERG